MSFSKTVSIFAGLGSIFAVSLTAYKLSQDSQSTQVQSNPLEERIVQLEKELKEAKEQVVTQQTNPPAPVVLPQPSTLKPPVPVQLPETTTTIPSAPQPPTP